MMMWKRVKQLAQIALARAKGEVLARQYQAAMLGEDLWREQYDKELAAFAKHTRELAERFAALPGFGYFHELADEAQRMRASLTRFGALRLEIADLLVRVRDGDNEVLKSRPPRYNRREQWKRTAAGQLYNDPSFKEALKNLRFQCIYQGRCKNLALEHQLYCEEHLETAEDITKREALRRAAKPVVLDYVNLLDGPRAHSASAQPIESNKPIFMDYLDDPRVRSGRISSTQPNESAKPKTRWPGTCGKAGCMETAHVGAAFCREHLKTFDDVLAAKCPVPGCEANADTALTRFCSQHSEDEAIFPRVATAVRADRKCRTGGCVALAEAARFYCLACAQVRHREGIEQHPSLCAVRHCILPRVDGGVWCAGHAASDDIQPQLIGGPSTEAPNLFARKPVCFVVPCAEDTVITYDDKRYCAEHYQKAVTLKQQARDVELAMRMENIAPQQQELVLMGLSGSCSRPCCSKPTFAVYKQQALCEEHHAGMVAWYAQNDKGEKQLSDSLAADAAASAFGKDPT